VIDLPTTMMDLPEGQSWVFEMVNNILIEVMGTIAEQERLCVVQSGDGSLIDNNDGSAII
jgi:hypothetical protein